MPIMMPLKRGKILAPSLSHKARRKNNNALLAELDKAWVPAFASESCLVSITLITGDSHAYPDCEALPYDEYPGARTAVGFSMHGAGRDCCNKKQKRNVLLRSICPR